MNQPDLLAWTPPPQRYRSTDPSTSVEAAESVSPAIRDAQQQVLDWLGKQPNGATDEELLAAMGSRSSHFRTRRSELVDRGLVRDSGQTRKLASGRKGIVWVVK